MEKDKVDFMGKMNKDTTETDVIEMKTIFNVLLLYNKVDTEGFHGNQWKFPIKVPMSSILLCDVLNKYSINEIIYAIEWFVGGPTKIDYGIGGNLYLFNKGYYSNIGA